MPNLVVIENATITQMLGDPKMVKALPCLRIASNAAQQPRAGCGKCGRKNRQQAADYTEIKRCIAGLASEGKRTLKNLLDANKIRIIYVNGRGRIIKLTF